MVKVLLACCATIKVRKRIGRRHVPARRDIRRRPLRRNPERDFDLTDIGGEAGAATHIENITRSSGEPGSAVSLAASADCAGSNGLNRPIAAISYERKDRRLLPQRPSIGGIGVVSDLTLRGAIRRRCARSNRSAGCTCAACRFGLQSRRTRADRLRSRLDGCSGQPLF
jgi:hypothetical protein